jgi:succinylarginine dihydrolase
VLLCHERAFLPQPETLGRIQNVFEKVAGRRLHVIEVPTARLSVEDAVSSYLFNSQILSLPSGEMRLVCPLECQEIPAAQQTIDWIVNEPTPIAGVAYFDLRQSMRNGGGPACLRLRVLLNEPERRAVRGRVWLDAALYDELSAWVERHYPERLSTDDLAAPELITACAQAQEELARIIDLPLTAH